MNQKSKLVITLVIKVLLAYGVRPELLELYRKRLPSNVELITPSDLDSNCLETYASETDIFVGYRVTEGFLKKAKKLKHIQVPWTGSEHLDFDLLKQYESITVSNSHSYALATAEHAVALFMAVAKRIAMIDASMRRGDWSIRYDSGSNLWLTNKVLGVLGFGRIGQNVARMMSNGFDMQVHALKRYPERIPAEAIFHRIYGPDGLEKILEISDYVLVSLPLTNETRGLLGKAELSLMKSTCILVNVARGPIIEEKVLFTLLKENRIAGAGIDAWWVYPKDRNRPKDNFQNFPFHELPNVVMTPHLANKTPDRIKISLRDTIENILRVSRNRPPINQLNLELGY
ncbi:MAG: 2-hydroxyacid dehydrogenase [Candidatus Thorarchaeota archaeon]